MWAEKTMENLSIYAEDCYKTLPQLDEIVNLEKTIIEFDKLIFDTGETYAERVKKEADSFKEISTKLSNYQTLELEEKENELLQLKDKSNELSKKIISADLIYDEKLKQKAMMSSDSNNLQMEQDLIAAFKLGTLSHFSFNRKIKFGYILNQKTLKMRTFSFDTDKETTEQEIQEKWDLLKSIVEKE